MGWGWGLRGGVRVGVRVDEMQPPSTIWYACMCMCMYACACACALLVQQPPRLLIVRGAVLGEQPQLSELGSGLGLGSGFRVRATVRTRARDRVRVWVRAPYSLQQASSTYYGAPRRRRAWSERPRWAGSSTSPGSTHGGQCYGAPSPPRAPRMGLQQDGSAPHKGMRPRAQQCRGSAPCMGLQFAPVPRGGRPLDRPPCEWTARRS